MSRYILIFYISLCICSGLSANHIIGGDVTYQCITSDSVRAEILVEFQIFRDGRPLAEGSATSFDSLAFFGVYKLNNGIWEFVTQVGPEDSLVDEPVPLNDLECLVFPPSLISRRGLYRFPLTLDIIDQNYMIAYQRCCRGQNISNLVEPENEGSVFSIEITPEGLLSCNDAITFRQFPPSILCAEFPFRFDHSVIDTEGDSVVYELCTPISSGGRSPGVNNAIIQECRRCTDPRPECGCDLFAPCPQLCGPEDFSEVRYRFPFTETTPVIGNPDLTINPSTGLITGTPTLLGELVMAVCATEYRDGKILTKIRRDMQFVVSRCERDLEARVASNRTNSDGSFDVIACGDNVVEFQSLSQQERFISEYVWTFDLGNDSIVVSNEKDPIVEFPGLGSYDAKLLLNPEAFICTDSAFINVSVFPDIEAEYDLAFDSCIAGPVEFMDLSRTFADEIESWNWDFGDGNQSTRQDPTHTFLQPGLQTVELTVTDNNECEDDITKSFFYTPIPENLAVLPNYYITCIPGTVTFDNVSEPIDSTYDVLWDFGDGSMGPERMDLSPTHTYTEPGEYTIRLSVTSPTGCSSTQTFRNFVEILDGFSIDFNYSPPMPTIQQNSVTFMAESEVPGESFWSFGDGNFSVEDRPTHTYTDTGLYLVSLILTDATGCRDSLSKEIYIAPIVDLIFPNAFTPDGDDTNDIFRGVGQVSLISYYELLIFDRWGKIVFKTNDPLEGWNGKMNNSGQQLPMGVYTYLSRYDVPRSERQERRGIATLLR